MRVAVTSGRLAGPLADGLAEAGHDVVRLVEREASGPGERLGGKDSNRGDEDSRQYPPPPPLLEEPIQPARESIPEREKG